MTELPADLAWFAVFPGRRACPSRRYAASTSLNIGKETSLVESSAPKPDTVKPIGLVPFAGGKADLKRLSVRYPPDIASVAAPPDWLRLGVICLKSLYRTFTVTVRPNVERVSHQRPTSFAIRSMLGLDLSRAGRIVIDGGFRP